MLIKQASLLQKSRVAHLFENFGVKSVAKNYLIESLPSLSIKILFSMVSGLFAQLQVFLLLHLREFPVLLKHLRLLKLQHAMYLSLLMGGLGRWSSLQTQVLWNFRTDIWPYFVISQLNRQVVLDGTFCKSIQLMLLMAQFLVPLFSHYISMILLVILFIILLSILIILLSTI